MGGRSNCAGGARDCQHTRTQRLTAHAGCGWTPRQPFLSTSPDPDPDPTPTPRRCEAAPRPPAVSPRASQRATGASSFEPEPRRASCGIAPGAEATPGPHCRVRPAQRYHLLTALALPIVPSKAKHAGRPGKQGGGGRGVGGGHLVPAVRAGGSGSAVTKSRSGTGEIGPKSSLMQHFSKQTGGVEDQNPPTKLDLNAWPGYRSRTGQRHLPALARGHLHVRDGDARATHSPQGGTGCALT